MAARDPGTLPPSFLTTYNGERLISQTKPFWVGQLLTAPAEAVVTYILMTDGKPTPGALVNVDDSLAGGTISLVLSPGLISGQVPFVGDLLVNLSIEHPLVNTGRIEQITKIALADIFRRDRRRHGKTPR